MSIEIKTTALQPVRNTFANIERRFGDKPASRYQEASYDMQPSANFHYRPLWQPQYELNDVRRTAIVMQDWYDLRDPRQYYYGSYVQARAKMQETAESNYGFFEQRDLVSHLTDEVKTQLIKYLLPLRHVEHTANLNNVNASAYGYGTALTQAFMFAGMDRLGIAQYLSRIGLVLDGNTGASLAQAKGYWMEEALWQGVRAYCEETLVVADWFEVVVAQNVVCDNLMCDLYYNQFDQWLNQNQGQDVGLLTEFMRVWYKDISRWLDSILKTVVAESPENKTLLETWVTRWREKGALAWTPVADAMLGVGAMAQSLAVLDARLERAGLFK